MTDSTTVLCLTAAAVGFAHTLLGPDHYLPFVAMSRAGGWSRRKTVAVTLLCGVGHVLSSTLLGLIGIGLGVGLFRIEALEKFRGELAGWLMLAFGLTYLAWGLKRALRHRPHAHWHAHGDGTVHSHTHVHSGEHLHVHDNTAVHTATPASVTPWVLFTVFLFGPCEPLIPLLMYPAAKGSLWSVVLVTAVFGITTLVTMTALVLAVSVAGRLRVFDPVARFGHALAGFVVVLCGVAIKVGW